LKIGASNFWCSKHNLFDGNMSATVVRKAKINYLEIIWMEKSEGTHFV
jgi:hypothetical protein